MTTKAIASVLQSIPDNQAARLSLSTIDGERLYLDCTYREGNAPRFFLFVSAKNLPENINTALQCSVTIDNRSNGSGPLVLTAKIEEVIGDGSLELTAKDISDPTKLREYFRVALSAPVILSSSREAGEGPDEQWSLQGETLDLSGSGLLAVFDGECQERNQIKITLEFSSPPSCISCLGHIVHARRVRKGRWQIALHFDDITAKQRDIIISNCLFEQRRQLKKGLQPTS